MNVTALRPRGLLGRTVLTVGVIALALVIRLAILPADGRVVFSTFYPAVAVVTLLAGYQFGLVSLALGGLLAYLFLVPPIGALKVLTLEQGIGFATYLVAGAIICLSFSKYLKFEGAKGFTLRGAASRTAVMVLLIVFAYLVRITVLPADSRVIYSTFYPAIAIITLVCGFRYGLVSMGLGAVVSYYFLLEPVQAFKWLNMEQTIGLLTYVMAATIICMSLREVIIRGQRIRRANEELQDLMTTNSIGFTLEELVRVIASTVEMRDPYTSGHQERVSALGVAIGTKMGLPERNLIGIKLGGLVHDLGKMRVPIEILTKPGELTEGEWMLITEHPQHGYNALKELQSPWPLADIVHQHHERVDGSGYPNHLRGDEILIEARILAVADVVEAMTAMRPYREGLGQKAALDEIRKHSGTRYDPDVVTACVELLESGEYVISEHRAGWGA